MKHSLKMLVAKLFVAITLVGSLMAGVQISKADSTMGPYKWDFTLGPKETKAYVVDYYGNPEATILASVKANGTGDVDIYVYDAYGHEIVKDTNSDSHPECRFYPYYRHTFTIKIVNCEDRSVNVHAETN